MGYIGKRRLHNEDSHRNRAEGDRDGSNIAPARPDAIGQRHYADVCREYLTGAGSFAIRLPMLARMGCSRLLIMASVYTSYGFLGYAFHHIFDRARAIQG